MADDRLPVWDEAEMARVYAELRAKKQRSVAPPPAPSPPPPPPPPPPPRRPPSTWEPLPTPAFGSAVHAYVAHEAPVLHEALTREFETIVKQCVQLQNKLVSLRSTYPDDPHDVVSHLIELNLRNVITDLSCAMNRTRVVGEFVKRVRTNPACDLEDVATKMLRYTSAPPLPPPKPKNYAFLGD
jgi:hypothetical protein